MQQRTLYEVRDLPVFQNRVFDTAEGAQACPRGDVRLVEDMDTGLVHNAAFRPELMDYDANYQNEQGNSPLFRQHVAAVADIVAETLGLDRLIEIGCGKASFLELLQARGADITGFDPTYEGSNPRVSRTYFAPGADYRADGIILRHVLEHVRDPYSFLSSIRDANGGRGRIYIEVPCFDWICERRTWFDVFYEHVNYFRLSDFERMFSQTVRGGRLFGDQYLYVVADLEHLRRPQRDAAAAPELPADFTRTITDDIAAKGVKTVVWGAASKGVIFSLLKQRHGQTVDAVIDINPAKQGKYIPATGLRVYAPDEILADLPNGSVVYVMNSNYLDEIRAAGGDNFIYRTID